MDPIDQFEMTSAMVGVNQRNMTNQLLASIQQSIEEDKETKQYQRNLENYIFNIQKDLNRARFLLEKNPQEGFKILCTTKNFITRNYKPLNEVHSLEYKRLFEVIDYDCENLWQWSSKHLTDLFEARNRIVQEINSKIAALHAKKKDPVWSVFYLAYVCVLFVVGFKITKFLYSLRDSFAESIGGFIGLDKAGGGSLLSLAIIGVLIIVMAVILLNAAGVIANARDKKIENEILALNEELFNT